MNLNLKYSNLFSNMQVLLTLLVRFCCNCKQRNITKSDKVWDLGRSEFFANLLFDLLLNLVWDVFQQAPELPLSSKCLKNSSGE